MNSLKYVRPGNGFVPAFPLFQKVNVNGDKEDSLFKWLKGNCHAPTDVIVQGNSALWKPIRASDIRWNFEKFLIDDQGVPYRRYSDESYPLDIQKDIERLQHRCLKRSGFFKGLPEDIETV